MFKNKEDFIKQLNYFAQENVNRDYAECGIKERYELLAGMIAARARIIQAHCRRKVREEGAKRVYYFSLEFLTGRLLNNYLMNFGVRELAAEALKSIGDDLDLLCEQENDPGLGNGGLGRLSACFLDSMAALGIAGNGNGIFYRYGLFKQEIKNGQQVEKADNWAEGGFPWASRKPEEAIKVRFGGKVERNFDGGLPRFNWVGGEEILAVPYDVPIVGFGGETVNNLRLWSAEPLEENFDMEAFNRGDYAGAMKHRAGVMAITAMLYPSDSADPGKILRLKQEYLFVSAGISNMLNSYKKNYGSNLSALPDYVAIQINDTHPALCVPELLRQLIDLNGLSWDEAWSIVNRTIAFTNHTILPEASETWPIDIFKSLLPRVYDFVEEIDRRYRESFPKNIERWQEAVKNTAVLWDGKVRMVNLCIISAHSVNGVAAMHSEILKTRVLADFCRLMPQKFNNKTNGVSHRRFLAESNPSYASLITSAIGDGWLEEPQKLAELSAFANDSAFLEKAAKSKALNKERLAAYVEKSSGVKLDSSFIFDVQVKRFHGYKRQLLNLFKIMALYDSLKEDPGADIAPTAFILAGKAAQSYEFAKEVIRLANAVADKINSDPDAAGKLQVAFVPNFSVSNGQLIYPAADISEQISTAGMEASGTGCMKFMMNGAVTLGTQDGANAEIAEAVGPDNIRIFGLTAPEIDEIKRRYSYYSWDEYNGSSRLSRVVDHLENGFYVSPSGSFSGICDQLMRSNDEFFVLKDFESYMKAWSELTSVYTDRQRWMRMSVLNTAASGRFSSDRTIREYASDIWNIRTAR